MTTTATRSLANTAVNIIVSANSSAQDYTEADARAADIDLLIAHMESGQMDEATRVRASRTLRQLSKGQRRY
jgi:ABC-type molybdenum transport system ATPase subunit/photorepair protein PhrA